MLKMYNVEVETFIDFLMGLELPAKESRMRTRFCKLGLERLSLIEEEKMDIIKKHANLDENGEIKQKEDSEGRLVWDVQDIAGFDIDFRELMMEEWIIELNEERRDMLESLKVIVLNLDVMLKGQEAMQYDRWCEIIEAIQY